MSILNTADIERIVDRGVYLSTFEETERRLLEELDDGLNQFQGSAVCEQTLFAIRAWYNQFGEHVNCVYGVINQLRNLRIEDNAIKGTFAYQTIRTIGYKCVEFSLT